MLYSNIFARLLLNIKIKKIFQKKYKLCKKSFFLKMSTLRLISTLRSSLLTTKYSRIVLPFSRMSFQSISSIDLDPSIPVRIQQICLFSSSTILHAQRRDKIDSNVVEEFDDKEEEEEEDNDTDQVIYSFF